MAQTEHFTSHGQGKGQSTWLRRGLRALQGAALFLAAACSEEPAPDREREPLPSVPQVRGEAEAEPAALSDSHWRLVEIREAHGETVQPDDPENYIFTFRSGGTLAMKLNCNRASAGWEAEQTVEGQGVLAVGTPVVTRAHCPPPTLDERIAQEVETISAWAVDDGRLHLGLAGGGAYILEPAKGPG